MIGLIMFAVALLLLLVGFPVAFTFGGVAVFFGLLAEGPEIFSLMPHRIWSIMNNTILMAIPLFIFMGIVLQKSKLAERLLESMGFLFGEVRGGIAISTILVGALLAASTGVVGASVVAMGVFVTQSTKIVYRDSGEVIRGHIPPYSVVVPGTLPRPDRMDQGTAPLSGRTVQVSPDHRSQNGKAASSGPVRLFSAPMVSR